MLRVYSELATWWPLFSPLEEYADEAEFFGGIPAVAGLPPEPSLLELGCGGGSIAFYLKKLFETVTLTDISPEMLGVSRTLNPDCEHAEGDMRTMRLGRVYDAVFVHDAIDYMITAGALRQAVETAFVHCKQSGVAIFVPDHVRETFQASTEHGGKDGDGRGLRYLEWTYDPDQGDTNYSTEYAFLLRVGDAPVQMEHETHTCGLFPRAEWLRQLREAGFEPAIVRDPYGRDVFVGRRR